MEARKLSVEELENRRMLTPITPQPLSETFALHSNPGVNHTIYLDFDGHVTSGTIWNALYAGGNDIASPAFSFEGGPGSFTDNELTRMQWIWYRVAEDFMPFNVNVTTEDPGVEALRKTPNDTEWGVRVVIGGSSSNWYGQAVGGVAFVGSFNMSNDTPVFVFPTQLSGGNEKYVAGAISHEVGHSLGLNHHGRTSPSEEYFAGHGDWAPIMGNPYQREVTQWSHGEYANANLASQDDIHVIASQNGFGFRQDDYADPTSLRLQKNKASASGIIETREDVDVFYVSTDRAMLDITAQPAWRDANLDILLELMDKDGNILAASSPLDTLDAHISYSAPRGTSYIRVSGVGKGNAATNGYSDYGSLGQYSITINVTPQPDKMNTYHNPPAERPTMKVRDLIALLSTHDLDMEIWEDSGIEAQPTDMRLSTLTIYKNRWPNELNDSWEFDKATDPGECLESKLVLKFH